MEVLITFIIILLAVLAVGYTMISAAVTRQREVRKATQAVLDTLFLPAGAERTLRSDLLWHYLRQNNPGIPEPRLQDAVRQLESDGVLVNSDGYIRVDRQAEQEFCARHHLRS